MTTFTIIIAAIGLLVSLAAWWGVHWLAGRMDADDAKDRGIK